MDKTTEQYLCKSCQLQFKDFKEYVDHKYKKHDGRDVQPEINKDDDASSPKELENSELTDSSSDNFNQPLDLSVSRETQFHHDVIREATTTPLWSRNVTGYSQEVCSRYHSNPDDSRNDSFLSLKYSQNEMVNLGMDLQLGRNQPSISFDYNPLEIHSRRISGIFHPNQSPISEQMQLFRQSNNEYLNATESSTSSGIRHISQRSPQVSTNPSSVSLVYIPIQSSAFEMTQSFHTNQRILSSERQKCVINTLETNPQSSVDHRVATEVRDIDSLVESALSPEDRGVHEMNINFEKYSENIRKNLDSVGRSIRHRESKHPRKECFDEKNVSVSSINQNENVAQNKTPASNSPLEKISDAQSEEILRQGERSRNVLHNKRDEIRYQYNTKNTRVYESGEMNLKENSNQTRDPRADIKIKPRTCEKCENLFNEESNPVEISANKNKNKTFVSEFCNEKFRSKHYLMKHKKKHTVEQKSILNLIESETIRQRGQNDHNVVHTRERPDELDKLKIDIKLSSTSLGIRHISERFPKINTDTYAVSLGNRGVESSIERNQHWNTIQLSMSSENKPEFNTQRMDLHSSANQRAVTDNNDNSLLKRLVSSPRVRIDKMNQNLKKYSKENCIKLDSVGRSTKTFGDRKHTNTEYIDPCGACIPTMPQNKIEAQNIISAPNSSLKHHFHFRSEETSKKHENCRLSLNNENNQVQAHNKDIYATECGSIEKKLGDVSNSSNQQGSGKKKFTSDCENFKCSSNQQSNLVKNDVDCNGKKKHVCDICLKIFNYKGNLKQHKLIHTGLKPFKCGICSNVFRQKGQLKIHKAVHSELRPFKCDKCKMDFKRRYDLTVHIRSHTQEKTFKCDNCGKKFKSKNGLKYHKCAYTRN
ncbi:zinc finger protein 16 [Trichonephila clavipes]|nr:zinc finger protein 16 [Trichonephila clavipes]